jgi:acyl-[acyl-carrier-protein]-phospholipid O-acyltransferase/long-chain-fatty-acid--[acyl-carrier-protein] ligase
VDDILDESCRCAVTSVPDEGRGERIVVLFTDPAMTPHALWERLGRTELPRLWLPKRDDVVFVESIPTLGTGKTDLRAVRQLALDRGAPPSPYFGVTRS